MASNTILDEVVYQANEAARLLGLPDKTLRRWLDGDRKHGEFTDPLIRPEATGSSEVTWGEFVEAGFLRQYRVRRLPIARLRPLLSALREELDTRYPLAEGRPLSRDGRKLLWRLQERQGLDRGLYLVVEGMLEGYQLALTPVVEEFVQHVEFDPFNVRPFERWYPLGVGTSELVLDPRRSFGLPSIKGVRTETLAELRAAGESERSVVSAFRSFGMTTADVREAVVFEHFMRKAAQVDCPGGYFVFVDANLTDLGKWLVDEGSAGVIHVDHPEYPLSRDAPDEEWLDLVGGCGWGVLMRDKRVDIVLARERCSRSTGWSQL